MDRKVKFGLKTKVFVSNVFFVKQEVLKVMIRNEKHGSKVTIFVDKKIQ